MPYVQMEFWFGITVSSWQHGSLQSITSQAASRSSPAGISHGVFREGWPLPTGQHVSRHRKTGRGYNFVTEAIHAIISWLFGHQVIFRVTDEEAACSDWPWYVLLSIHLQFSSVSGYAPHRSSWWWDSLCFQNQMWFALLHLLMWYVISVQRWPLLPHLLQRTSHPLQHTFYWWVVLHSLFAFNLSSICT